MIRIFRLQDGSYGVYDSSRRELRHFESWELIEQPAEKSVLLPALVYGGGNWCSRDHRDRITAAITKPERNRALSIVRRELERVADRFAELQERLDELEHRPPDFF